MVPEFHDYPNGDVCTLDAVIATDQLCERIPRSPDPAIETRLLLELTRELAEAPDAFFQTLAEATLEMCRAGSAGISLLNEKTGRFVWPAIAGALKPFLGGGTPRDFGPCGTVLHRDSALLFLHPERHFTYLKPIQPPLEEVLVVPFYMGGHAVGTMWAVLHEKGRKFNAEDKRSLENLCTFAASAYQVLSESGTLNAHLSKLPQGDESLEKND